MFIYYGFYIEMRISVYILIFLIVIVIVIIILIIYAVGKKSPKNKKFSLCEKTGIKMSPKLTNKDISDWNIAQKKMTNMFREFVRICNKHQITNWWVTGGTLIGTVRHGGFIPWDGDIDLAMIEDDYDKFKKVVQNELPNNMWFQSTETDEKRYTQKGLSKIRDLHSCYKHLPKKLWHSGLQLDIFIYKKEHDKLVPIFKMTDIKTYSNDFILPAGKKYFDDIEVNVPRQVEEYCKENFGDVIPKLPPISERRPHEGMGYVDPLKTCDFHYDMYPEIYK